MRFFYWIAKTNIHILKVKLNGFVLKLFLILSRKVGACSEKNLIKIKGVQIHANEIINSLKTNYFGEIIQCV